MPPPSGSVKGVYPFASGAPSICDVDMPKAFRTGGTTTHMPQPTVPRNQLKKTMGSRSINRTTQPLACVAVRNCALMSAELSATKAWLPMDMALD